MFGVIVDGVFSGILKFHTAVMPIKHKDEWCSGVSNSHTARPPKIPVDDKISKSNPSSIQPQLNPTPVQSTPKDLLVIPQKL